MKMKYCRICGSVAIIKEKETEFYCAKCYLIKQKKENENEVYTKRNNTNVEQNLQRKYV